MAAAITETIKRELNMEQLIEGLRLPLFGNVTFRSADLGLIEVDWYQWNKLLDLAAKGLQAPGWWDRMMSSHDD